MKNGLIGGAAKYDAEPLPEQPKRLQRIAFLPSRSRRCSPAPAPGKRLSLA
jgi:hypothetical protein